VTVGATRETGDAPGTGLDALPPGDYVEVGRLGRPYGVNGWSHVESWTEPPAALLRYRHWVLKAADGSRRPANRQGVRAQGTGIVARVDGSETPERAAALTGTVIEVARGDLPPAPPGEYYRDDLLGFSVRNLEGADLGVLRAFLDMPAHPVMVVVDGERERWLPLTSQHLRRVDPVARLLSVDWPEDF
jgi:16S rRNA processing protein RimM